MVRLSLGLRISPTRIMSIHFLRSRGGGERGGEEGCWGGRGGGGGVRGGDGGCWGEGVPLLTYTVIHSTG